MDNKNCFQYADKANKPIMVCFGANWCVFCIKFKPIWEDLKQRIGVKNLIWIDFDDNKSLCEVHFVSSFPTIKRKDSSFKGNLTVLSTNPLRKKRNLPKDRFWSQKTFPGQSPLWQLRKRWLQKWEHPFYKLFSHANSFFS